MSESKGLIITGLKETKAALEALGITVEKKIIRKGLRAGGKIVKAAAQAEAPSRTGLLASKIKVNAGRSAKGKISINVGLKAKDFTGVTFYAAFVLYGHKVGSRKLGDSRTAVPANNFLERAAKSAAQAAIDAASQTWTEQIDQAAANQGKG